MLAVTTFTFTACSDDLETTEKSAKPVGSKISADKPKFAPDKAIEDFVMVQFYGTTGDDNEAAASTGMKPDEIDKFFKNIKIYFIIFIKWSYHCRCRAFK